MSNTDGWIEWHGGECPVDGSEVVEVKMELGRRPATVKAETCDWHHNGICNHIIAYRIHQPEKEEAPMTIEQILTKANKHAAKAQKHERKAAKHTARQLEYFARAAGMVTDGYELRVKDDGEVDVVVQPTEDMTDPANWKAGDVVESTGDVLNVFSKGSKYTLASEADSENGEDWMVTIRNDDEGDECHAECTYFRWISRPQ